MKFHLFCLLLISLSTTSLKAQGCGCDNINIRDDLWDCTPQKLKNGATLTWHYNCEESWLVFENKQSRIKKIIYSNIADPRIGFVNYIEYDNRLLFQNEVISGCCTPPDFILFSKNTGNKIRNIGKLLYADLEKIYPFVVHLDDNQQETNKKKFVSIIVTNINNNKTKKIKLPKGLIESLLNKEPSVIYAEELFDEVVLEKNILKISYKAETQHDKRITLNISELK